MIIIQAVLILISLFVPGQAGKIEQYNSKLTGSLQLADIYNRGTGFTRDRPLPGHNLPAQTPTHIYFQVLNGN